jgi:hypothetical protein
MLPIITILLETRGRIMFLIRPGLASLVRIYGIEEVQRWDLTD